MCPDEEVIQSEVAEANKKLVKKASVDEGSGAEDEDSLLPESLQKQNETASAHHTIEYLYYKCDFLLQVSITFATLEDH